MKITKRAVAGWGSALLVVCVAACAPQSTNIVTEIHHPDGTIERYTNLSQGFGYNPNVTANMNIGGIRGTAATPSIIAPNSSVPWNLWGPTPAPWLGPWNCQPFTYVSCPTITPGAAPIPVNLNVYGWAPAVR